MTARIIATSRQTRFQPGSASSLEIDLNDVSISIGERELLSSAHLKLNKGIKYVLIGRNGTGKSTIFQAIADKLIPGIPSEMKILLMGQQLAKVEEQRPGETVLEWVVRSDQELEDARRKAKCGYRLLGVEMRIFC